MHQWALNLIDMSSKYFYQLPSDWQLIVFLAIIVFSVMAVFLTASAILYLVLYLIWKAFEIIINNFVKVVKKIIRVVIGG